MKSFLFGATMAILIAGTMSGSVTKSSGVATTRVGGGAASRECHCSGFYARHMKVCGTDQQDYNTACDLGKAMALNSSLGLLCNRRCFDCPSQSPLSQKCTNTMRIAFPQTRKAGGKPRPLRHKKADPRWVKKYCLTDGTEWTRNTIYCALASRPGVGIRCMGFCKQCKTINNACPAKLLQDIPYYDEMLPQ
ncbi:hypothetical protein BV898_06103 [Hypsibius exemplaris]|uniref:Kazal-like domain-containing protein n=1 Tax=Hypsibius exemplaris TaxID=2072580 RepID=A0A1W0WXF5_HYPEX|nr:hypothetical protein BV898_06103 [Hypsibius exemplaris]